MYIIMVSYQFDAGRSAMIWLLICPAKPSETLGFSVGKEWQVIRPLATHGIRLKDYWSIGTSIFPLNRVYYLIH